MHSRAVGLAWTMGFGWCGSGRPKRGASWQMRQARSSARRSSRAAGGSVGRNSRALFTAGDLVGAVAPEAVVGEVLWVSGFEPGDAVGGRGKVGDAVADHPGAMEAPAERSGDAAATVLVADRVAPDPPAAVLDRLAADVAEHAPVGGVVLRAEHPPAGVTPQGFP